MTLDERLRAELRAALPDVESDDDGALERVVAQARGRQRRDRLVLATLAAAILVVVAVGFSQRWWVTSDAPVEPSNHTHTTQSPGRGAQLPAVKLTPLTGEWQSEPAPAAVVRAAVATAGYPALAIDPVLRRANQWSVQVTFDPAGGMTAVDVATSDPTNPGASLSRNTDYRYDLRPGHRLLLLPREQSGPRLVLGYRITGDRLMWHFVHAEGGTIDGRTAALIVSWTARPLQLVGGSPPTR